MKITNSLSAISDALYKIYEDCVLISNDFRNRDIKVESIELIVNDWLDTINEMKFKNKKIRELKQQVLDQILDLKRHREINVYIVWDIQNKIDSLKTLVE